MSAETKTDTERARWIEEILAEAPPLTDEQRARFSRMLSGGDGR